MRGFGIRGRCGMAVLRAMEGGAMLGGGVQPVELAYLGAVYGECVAKCLRGGGGGSGDWRERSRGTRDTPPFRFARGWGTRGWAGPRGWGTRHWRDAVARDARYPTLSLREGMGHPALGRSMQLGLVGVPWADGVSPGGWRRAYLGANRCGVPGRWGRRRWWRSGWACPVVSDFQAGGYGGGGAGGSAGADAGLGACFGRRGWDGCCRIWVGLGI